jgi:membrane protein
VKPKLGFNLKELIWNRLVSFAMVVGLGFLLMVSLIVSAGLAALGHWFSGWSGVHPWWDVVNLIVSTGVIMLLFACIYRFLPDVRLQWRDVWMGALVTAVLFSIGKELIGLYIGQSGTASTYGAAGSLVVLLLWVYYSSQIVLLGAEFTRVYTERTRSTPAPEPYATKEPATGKKTPGGVGVNAA